LRWAAKRAQVKVVRVLEKWIEEHET